MRKILDGVERLLPKGNKKVLNKRYRTRKSSTKISTNDLPFEPGYVGHFSAYGILYSIIFCTVPIAYIYTFFILLRELCMAFPDSLYYAIRQYIPLLAWFVSKMEKSSLFVEIWCIIEGVFFIIMKLRIQWLQMIDPLEASLSAAPMMDCLERARIWSMMFEAEDPIEIISGWFFDMPIEEISRYDVVDWTCWSMFDGRNQEHLTCEELDQLESFVELLEEKISMKLYDNRYQIDQSCNNYTENQIMIENPPTYHRNKKRRKQEFRFPELTAEDSQNFLSTIYENYKQAYERSCFLLEEIHPMQDLRHMISDAEERTMATATHMYENASTTATQVASNAYKNIVGTGSNLDKHLAAISHATQQQLSELSNATQQQLSELSSATQQQLAEGWKKVIAMKERLETFHFLSNQTKRMRLQLKSYRIVLSRMREMSSSVPSKQMAQMMRRITECNEAMENLETKAMDRFVKATGFARKNLLGRHEPKRYAKYSSDPLLGVGTFPLAFHLLILSATEIPLRIMMKNRGFTRLETGPITYYYNAGNGINFKTPLVFIHGIGVGLIVYMGLIDSLLETGRPILLPEISYISGFRPYQSRNAVLPPAVVCSTLIEMLAKHGYLRAAFIGHSYGTAWLAYMCKYANHAIAALLFLDPICFCLHYPRLTKQFVYHQPDIGTITYMVRTDIVVSWTIQRCFPWSWIILFAEQINVPSSVFLSSEDMLVPSNQVFRYLKRKGSPTKDFTETNKEHFASGAINVTVFRGDVHGGWTEQSDVTCPVIAGCAEILCSRAEEKQKD